MTMIQILPMYLKHNCIERFTVAVRKHRTHSTAVYEKDTQVFVSEINEFKILLKNTSKDCF